MSFIFDLLSSAGFGSIIGLAGGAFTKWMEQKAIRESNRHELAMMGARKDLMIETAKLEMETAEVMGKLAVDKLEAKAFETSQKTSELGNTLKSFVRPILLFTLGYFTWDIYDKIDTMVNGLESLPSADILAIYKIVILSIISLFTMGYSWYFAQRSSKQFDRMTARLMK